MTFALVSLVALSVAFYAATKIKNREHQVALLKARVDTLSQTEKALRGSLQEVEAKHAQETKSLKEALLQEELKNEALAKEFQRQQIKTAQNVEATEGKETNIPNFTGKSSTSRTKE